MWLALRWIGLGAAAFSFSILLQRNFVLEPSATFGGLTYAYRDITALLFGWLEYALAPLLRALAQALHVGDLRLSLDSDVLIQDGFIVLAVFMTTLSRGLTTARAGIVALIGWGTVVALATAVLRSSAGTLQPLPDEVPTEVSSAIWDFYKVQLVVIAPLIYLIGVAALSVLRPLAIEQGRLAPVFAATCLTAVPLAAFARAINATVLPVIGIDPFSSYLGVGAALVPGVFIIALAAASAATATVTARMAVGYRERADGRASHAAGLAQIAGDLAALVAGAALLLAANSGLRAAGL